MQLLQSCIDMREYIKGSADSTKHGHPYLNLKDDEEAHAPLAKRARTEPLPKATSPPPAVSAGARPLPKATPPPPALLAGAPNRPKIPVPASKGYPLPGANSIEEATKSAQNVWCPDLPHPALVWGWSTTESALGVEHRMQNLCGYLRLQQWQWGVWPYQWTMSTLRQGRVRKAEPAKFPG